MIHAGIWPNWNQFSFLQHICTACVQHIAIWNSTDFIMRMSAMVYLVRSNQCTAHIIIHLLDSDCIAAAICSLIDAHCSRGWLAKWMRARMVWCWRTHSRQSKWYHIPTVGQPNNSIWRMPTNDNCFCIHFHKRCGNTVANKQTQLTDKTINEGEKS